MGIFSSKVNQTYLTQEQKDWYKNMNANVVNNPKAAMGNKQALVASIKKNIQTKQEELNALNKLPQDQASKARRAQLTKQIDVKKNNLKSVQKIKICV